MGKRVDVTGTIVSNNEKWIYDFVGMDATSPKMVSDKLQEANGKDVDVFISSGGGDVIAGSDIYSMLRGYEGKVITKIVGLAASAASVIAMAGSKVLMSPTASFMIHNSTVVVRGDYRDLQQGVDMMKNVNMTIANAYVAKSGLPHKTFLDMMDKETWFTVQEAMNYKLVDGVLFEGKEDEKEKAQASLEMLKKKGTEGAVANTNLVLQGELQLLKLKGVQY